MVSAIQPAQKMEESDLEELLSNDFASGVIRAIKQFKMGKGRIYNDKDEFLDSLKCDIY